MPSTPPSIVFTHRVRPTEVSRLNPITFRAIWLLLLPTWLTACAGLPSLEERHATADGLAAARGWAPVRLHAGPFDLMAYLPARWEVSPSLTVYIEGDGLSWVSPSLPSFDPTPRNPIGLRLALAQPGGNAAYLARPCQYVDAASAGCAQRYWTSARFAPEVVEATYHAIDNLKARFKASRLTLVGYSGGGAVAALVAARRTDVERVLTVAGNLDTDAWVKLHHIAPLNGSLNPADFVEGLARVRQWHFAGGRDNVIPPSLIQGFANRFSDSSRPTVNIVSDHDHHCCWAENWPKLLEQVGTASPMR